MRPRGVRRQLARALGEVPGHAGQLEHAVPEVSLVGAERPDQLLERRQQFGQPRPLAEPSDLDRQPGVVRSEHRDLLALGCVSHFATGDRGLQHGYLPGKRRRIGDGHRRVKRDRNPPLLRRSVVPLQAQRPRPPSSAGSGAMAIALAAGRFDASGVVNVGMEAILLVMTGRAYLACISTDGHSLH